MFIVRGKKDKREMDVQRAECLCGDQVQEIMHGQVCKRDVCCGFCSKQCSSPALMKSTDQQVKGTASALIYLNLAAEDQYEILISMREKLLM